MWMGVGVGIWVCLGLNEVGVGGCFVWQYPHVHKRKIEGGKKGKIAYELKKGQSL